jgi:Holliday junction resolvase
MTSRKAKGNAAEREYAKMLESRGYVCELVTNARYGKQDMFGMFDIIGIKPSGIILVQVVCNNSRGRQKELRDFKILHCPPNADVVLAIKFDPGVRKTIQGWDERWM